MRVEYRVFDRLMFDSLIYYRLFEMVTILQLLKMASFDPVDCTEIELALV